MAHVQQRAIGRQEQEADLLAQPEPQMMNTGSTKTEPNRDLPAMQRPPIVSPGEWEDARKA